MSYLILGFYDGTFQRTIINGAGTKLEAMKNFNKVYPEFLIMSITDLNNEEKDWLNENNMPNNEIIDI